LGQTLTKADEHVVVMLDAADAFLQTTDAAKAKDACELFNTLVLFIKQKVIMSAVLLFADELLPSRLQIEGVNFTHVESTLVVGEASPAEMLAQLQELGVGKHLRELLVRVYGGHLWHIHVALSLLNSDVMEGRVASVWPAPLDSITDVVTRWEQAGRDRKEVVRVLEEVARCGFCPLAADADDKRVRALTEAGVCIYLTDGAEEYFIDPAVRQGRSGLAASTQLARVLIPVALKEFGRLPGSSVK
jgi:hypothetical protein